MIFHYTAGQGKQGTLTLVPSMSLINPQYVCVAEVEGKSMVVSNPGYNRAFRHDPAPHVDAIVEHIVEQVINSLDDWFDFEENNEPN